MEYSQNTWYALRLFRAGRKANLEKIKELCPQYYYIPTVPSILFVSSSLKTIEEIKSNFSIGAYPYTFAGTSRPISIPDYQMDAFMAVTKAWSEGYEVYDGDIKKGTHVRVLEGPFKDMEGYVLRVKGSKKFIVEIKGVVAVATAYIPQRFLLKLE